MISCELPDAQTPTLHPHRRVQSHGCALELDACVAAAAESARGSDVTVTTSTEAVG